MLAQLCLVLAAGCCSLVGAVEMTTVESAADLRRPAGWTRVGPAPPAHQLELTFAVKQTNLAQLESTLLATADPASGSYGNWLSNEEVHAMVAPARSSVDAVLEHLRLHSAGEVTASLNSDFVTVDVTVEAAEKILNTKFFRYTHASGHVVHRAEEYSLPRAVAEVVDFVAPAVHIPRISEAAHRSLEGTHGRARRRLQHTQQKLNTPAVLRELYNVGDAAGKSPKNKQAVTAFLHQLYNASDLARFYEKYWPKGAGTVINLVGDAQPGTGGIESMLDAEYATGMGLHVATEFWGFTGTAPDNKENEPFLKWLLQVASTSDDKVPLLFSTSYGEDEDSVSWAYATRIQAEFQKVGLRGISLLFASGDSGAAGDQGACAGAGASAHFSSKWPAASPYVTGVGATEGNTKGPGHESAAGLSSGGFSYRWAQGSYQTAAAAAYVQELGEGPPAAKWYNGTVGAGFPDISAQGVAFGVVAGGQDEPGVAGTSCASPTAAGVFALLNDARLQAGKKSLGFLNPMIYANTKGFNDITTGSGGGCRAKGHLKEEKGFPALKGWDPVTGVGTPDYQALLHVVSELP